MRNHAGATTVPITELGGATPCEGGCRIPAPGRPGGRRCREHRSGRSIFFGLLGNQCQDDDQKNHGDADERIDEEGAQIRFFTLGGAIARFPVLRGLVPSALRLRRALRYIHGLRLLRRGIRGVAIRADCFLFVKLVLLQYWHFHMARPKSTSPCNRL